MDELKKQLAEVRKTLARYANDDDLTETEVTKMNDLNKEAAKLEAKIAAKEQAIKAEEDTAKQHERELKEAVEEARREERAKANRLPFGDAPFQAKYHDTWKFDSMSAADMSLMVEMLQTNNKPVSSAAYKALSLKIADLDKTDPDSAYVKDAFKADTHIDPTLEAVGNAIKTEGDPMYSGTGTTTGAYWVGTAYSANLWRNIRASNQVVSKVPSDVIPDGNNNMYWPLESTDPTWYKVAEATGGDATLGHPATTVTSSQAAVNRKQITVGKLGARVLYSGEMSEDSLVQFVPQLREQLQISGAEILEHVMIDGDVQDCTSANINAIDTQPGEAEVYFLCDGFRKLPLVTNTANSRSAAGSLVIDDYVDTLKLMGTAGLAGSDPRQCAFIVDPNTHYANMKIPEVKTRDVSSAATIENGFLRAAYGVPIIPSWQMHRASAKRMAGTAGKIDADTDGNNLYGAIVAVRWDQWRQAYKRRMTLETTRIARADTWEIVALVRWGMAYRDTEASAITYYVGV